MGRVIVQAKLSVGPAVDAFEREADDVADRVVRSLRASKSTSPEVGHERGSATPRIQRAVAPSAEVGVAGGDLGEGTERVIRAAVGGGSPLPAASRSKMEGAFGADFSSIRVHTGPKAADLNRRIQASAFTTGNDVFFRDGMPDTTTSGGQHLLAHELTHTLQQGSATAAGVSRVAARSTQRQVVQRALTPSSTSKKDWDTLQTGKTGSGVSGVIFATNAAGEQIVVKGLEEPPQRAMLAQEMMMRAGLKTTTTVPVAANSSLGKHIIAKLVALGADLTLAGNPVGAQITAKATLWGGFATLLLMEPANVKNLSQLATQGPGLAPVTAPPVWQRARLHGAPDVAPGGHRAAAARAGRQAAADAQANIDLHANYWTGLLGSAKLWNQLGRLFYVDQFLGNEDRLESMKIQNVFIDDAGDIVAMDNDTMAADFISKITETDAVTNPNFPSTNVEDKTADDYIRDVINGGRMYGDAFQDRQMGALTLIAGTNAQLRASVDQKVVRLLGDLQQAMSGQTPNDLGAQVALAPLVLAPAPLQAAMATGAVASRALITQMFTDHVDRKKSTFGKLFAAQSKSYKTGKSPDAMYNFLALEIRYAYLERRSAPLLEDHATALAALQATYRHRVAGAAKQGTTHLDLDPTTYLTTPVVDTYK